MGVFVCEGGKRIAVSTLVNTPDDEDEDDLYFLLQIQTFFAFSVCSHCHADV